MDKMTRIEFLNAMMKIAVDTPSVVELRELIQKRSQEVSDEEGALMLSGEMLSMPLAVLDDTIGIVRNYIATHAGFNERLNDSEALQKMFADKLDKLADAFNEFRSFIVEQAVVTPDREGKTA